VTEFEILPSVDWLELDEHGVWAKTEPAQVYLIDPDTNEVSQRIPVGGAPCQGLGVGDGSVWACAGPDIVRIDPTTNEVVATFPVGKIYSQGQLPVSGGKVWVLTGDGSSLLAIDTATNTSGTPITLPARGTDLGAGRSGLWVVSAVDNVVMHVDPATGAVLSTTEATGPLDVDVEDDEVWVVASAETLRIDPSTGAIDLTVAVGGGTTGVIALTDDTAWVRNTETFVTRIDRATGEVIEDENTAVYAEIAGRLTSSGDMVVGFGSIWTSAYDDAKMFRISTGEPDAAS
jgi:DNA-binding beta-propeller fold protein YncE